MTRKETMAERGENGRIDIRGGEGRDGRTEIRGEGEERGL